MKRTAFVCFADRRQGRSATCLYGTEWKRGAEASALDKGIAVVCRLLFCKRRFRRQSFKDLLAEYRRPAPNNKPSLGSGGVVSPVPDPSEPWMPGP